MKKLIVLGILVLLVGALPVKAVSSYEMFYPMVAGKTVADGFVYKLKIFKETIRGALIFGPVQKADYNIFLASKRLLEAEKLLLEKNDDMALVTLNKVVMHLTQAKSSSENIKNLSSDLVKLYSTKVEVAKKLQEILKFAP